MSEPDWDNWKPQRSPEIDVIARKSNRVWIIDGVEYDSHTKACKAAGISKTTFFRRLKAGTHNYSIETFN